MAIANQALVNRASQQAHIDLGSLSVELVELLAANPATAELSADVYCDSVVMQAGELRNSCTHEVGADLLGPQAAELLCDLVRWAHLCGVDLVSATEVHLEAMRVGTPARPKLRGV
jgi:hypothetical protein